jgi:hypothetical protein
MVGPGNLTGDRAVHGSPHWRKAAVFPAEPGAEIARQLLETADIPVAVLNDRTGVFGPGFAGASHLGVTVLVPGDRFEEALELLEDVLESFGGETPDTPDA